ncbi:hypothetical protein NDU88_006694 [Pleurodeles waltl]|uniref:Uncharacterized protein n=1 Tax=Pleurodeles waltl TaxID=8319 RepID=A0AAV7RM67_PLEWA|nr:hypothetical protein NDU88_006694 [Pleurodeles waltl]
MAERSRGRVGRTRALGRGGGGWSDPEAPPLADGHDLKGGGGAPTGCKAEEVDVRSAQAFFRVLVVGPGGTHGPSGGLAGPWRLLHVIVTLGFRE